MTILDQFGKEYVPESELRSVNLDNYLRFLTDAPTSSRISPAGSFSLSTVYSCIRILSDAIAMTPFGLFQQTPGEPEITQIFDGQLAKIAIEASPLFNNFTFWQSMIASLNGWGNAYAVIIRSTNRLPTQLIYMTPNMVEVLDTTDPRYLFLRGETPFVYQVTTGMETFWVRPEDMVHLTLFTYDGLRGLSPITLHQDTMQVENEQTQYGRSFYSRGGKIQGVIESPLKSTREASKEFVTWFNTFYGGQNSGQVAFLPNGLTFKGVGVVNPQDAQWVEARKFTRQEIASIFRVPSYLLGDLDRATWGNVAQLSEEFVRYSLQPIYTLIEVELNRKLLDNARTLYYRFDPSVLLRGTTSERFANYSVAITSGFMSRSEVRQREGLSYNPELDTFIQMPGSAPVEVTEEDRSLALPGGQLHELFEWRQQSANAIQMNQASIIQSSISVKQQFDERDMAAGRLAAEQRETWEGRFTDVEVTLEQEISAERNSRNQLEADIKALIIEQANKLVEYQERLQGLSKLQEEFTEFIRIQKMRGTKHQTAIDALRSGIKQLEANLRIYVDEKINGKKSD